MSDHAAKTIQPVTTRSKWTGPVVVLLGLLAVAMLVAAWYLAHRPPLQPPEGLDGIEATSAGYLLLVGGGLPWLVQWAALAVLTAAVARAWCGVNWGAVLLGTLFPLVVGLIWWIGLGAMFWRSGPMEALLDAAFWSISRQFGSEPWGQGLLFEIIGPLTCPLRLQGPGSLQGWDFLWVGLSTALVMSTLTWVVRRTEADLSTPEKFNWRQFLLVITWTLLYLAPVYVRALLRVSGSG